MILVVEGALDDRAGWVHVPDDVATSVERLGCRIAEGVGDGLSLTVDVLVCARRLARSISGPYQPTGRIDCTCGSPLATKAQRASGLTRHSSPVSVPART